MDVVTSTVVERTCADVDVYREPVSVGIVIRCAGCVARCGRAPGRPMAMAWAGRLRAFLVAERPRGSEAVR